MSFSQVEYCLTSDDKVKLDAADILFIIIFTIIMTLTVASSYYDKTLKKTRGTPEELKAHYKLSVDGSSELGMRNDHWSHFCMTHYFAVNYRVSFSFLRNWNRLTMVPKTKSDRDLRCIHALRFITMYCVIIGHTILFLNVFPVYNPQYIELVNMIDNEMEAYSFIPQ